MGESGVRITVGELISKLQEYDESSPVHIYLTDQLEDGDYYTRLFHPIGVSDGIEVDIPITHDTGFAPDIEISVTDEL